MSFSLTVLNELMDSSCEIGIAISQGADGSGWVFPVSEGTINPPEQNQKNQTGSRQAE